MLNATSPFVMLNAVKHLVVQRSGFFASLRMTEENRNRMTFFVMMNAVPHLG